MFQFSPSVSMALHLKNHISSAICEVIRLLKNLMLSDSDENHLDYLLYKLEQAISVSSVKIFGHISLLTRLFKCY